MNLAEYAGASRGSHLQAIDGGKELERALKHAAECNSTLARQCDDLEALANRLGMYGPPEMGNGKTETPAPPNGVLPLLHDMGARQASLLARLEMIITRLNGVA